MTRYWFGGGPADWTLAHGANVVVGEVPNQITGRAAVVVGGITIRAYTAKVGGTQIVDLLDDTGAPVTEIVSADETGDDAYGQIPRFAGPDWVKELWISAQGGPRVLLTAIAVVSSEEIIDGPLQVNGSLDVGGPATFGDAVSMPGPLTVGGVTGTALGWLSVRAFGAAGDGVTDDAGAIQAALNACSAGGVVFLPPGRYAVTEPLLLPPSVTLRGSHVGGSAVDGTPSVIVALASWDDSDGSDSRGMVALVDREIGGYAVEHTGARLVDVTLNASAANCDGITGRGSVTGVVIDSVTVVGTAYDGFYFGQHTRIDDSVHQPSRWTITNCTVIDAEMDGFNLGSTSAMTLINCRAVRPDNTGFYLLDSVGSRLVGCHAERSGGYGFEVTGTYGGAGLSLSGCSTDGSFTYGISIDSEGNAPIHLSNVTLRRDGLYGGVGGNELAALTVWGESPVLVDGLTVLPGVEDDGTGVLSPERGVDIADAGHVVVASGYIHSAVQPWAQTGTLGLVHRGSAVTLVSGPFNAPVSESRAGLALSGPVVGVPTPRAAHDVIAWTCDPALIGAGRVTVGGTLYLAAVYVPDDAAPCTRIYWGVFTAAAGVTAGQNFVGLYNSAGVRLAAVGVDSVITTTGVKTTSFTEVVLTRGMYWVAFLFNASTPPTIYRSSELTGPLANLGLSTPGRYRFATNGTGRTSLPSPLTPGSNATIGFAFWAAVAP